MFSFRRMICLVSFVLVLSLVGTGLRRQTGPPVQSPHRPTASRSTWNPARLSRTKEQWVFLLLLYTLELVVGPVP